MDEADETVTNVRRTRSGKKVVKTPPSKPPARPVTRRSRKKVVLMEVEVSDEEEEVHQQNKTEIEEATEIEERREIEDKEPECEEKEIEFQEDEKEIDSCDQLNVKQDDNDVLSFLDENTDRKIDNTVHESTMEVDDEYGVIINSIPQFEEENSGDDNELNLLEERGDATSSDADNIENEVIGNGSSEIHGLPPQEESTSAFDDFEEKDADLDGNDGTQTMICEEEKEIEKLDEAISSNLVEENESNDNDETDGDNKTSQELIEMMNGMDSLSEDSNSIGKTENKQNGDPDAENISEDELPGVPVAKVPETEEVSDEELPGPKRAELPADTEVVSEDELPSVKKEAVKRKVDEGDYDPGSPTSENEVPAKKPALEADVEKEKDDKPAKPKKLPELDKYWKAVNDDPTDFTGWTYLLQYVDQENDMEAAREAYDAFLSHYPYCYGYWRKYADYEKRKGNKKKCEEVFERGLKAIPLSVDLWIHYLTYVKTTRPDDEDYIRSQFERAIGACGLEFRSDRLWDSYIKWETEAKRFQHVTAIYDRLLATPTQGYTSHFDNFQEHISSNSPNKVVEVDEFLALRKEVRHILKHDTPAEANPDNADAPPGDEDPSKLISSDEETKSIRERIVSIRRKIHKNTVNAVTARWNFEEGIKRPYFHVKPLERCQLKNWQDYLDYEIEQGDLTRIIVLFERCLIACALYEEFWLKFVHFLEGLKDAEMQSKIRDVYERACTIHHLKKPSLHLQWAMFEESVDNSNRAAEILVNLEKCVPNVLQVAYRRINLERRRGDNEKCCQLYDHYINNSKNKMISSNIAIKFSRFSLKVLKDLEKAQEVLKVAITKDVNNPRLYLQLIDLTLQKDNVTESEIVDLIDSFLEKEAADVDQKVLFAQRKLEFLEDFGSSISSVQGAYDQYQKYIKQSKDTNKKKEPKSESGSAKKEKSATQSSSQSSSYGNYGSYGTTSGQTSYPYSGTQQGQYNYSQYGQGDQYQYQNWQYPQGGYGGYNQWGSYSGGYGY